MSRLQQRFESLRTNERKALIPYITGGDPNPDTTVPLMHALVRAGADVIELGVPFSDPQADGPVIQRACQRALAHDVTLANILEMVAAFRRDDNETPVVLMGYCNPIESFGVAEFAGEAARVGVDGVLVVDQPPEEGGTLIQALTEQDIDPIFLIAPTTAADRMERICTTAKGFIYYVSLKGVTGAAELPVAEVSDRLGLIRRHTDIPVGVGFGIRDADSARTIARVADAVVVGSAVVSRVADHADDPEAITREVSQLIGSMRAALDERAA